MSAIVGLRMIKVLHLIRSLDPRGGGPAEVIRQLAGVRAAGMTMEVASLDPADALGTDGLGLPVHRLGVQAGGYGYSPQLVPWLRKHHSQFDAAIVHGLWQYHGRAARLALHGTRTPYFIFPHGMLDPWFRRAYPLKHWKKALYWRLVEHRVLRDAAAVLYTCEEERRLAQGTFRPYRANERVVSLGTAAPPGNPQDQRELFLENFPELRGKRLLLFLGRLHDKKGCDLLIRAFAELVLRHQLLTTEAPLHLVLAGPCADTGYLEYLRTLANPIAVSFPGMLTGDLKWGAYHAADAFILPSHQENFGIAVVEALACGLPVLISNKVNIWREMEADRAGLVAEDTLAGMNDLLQRWLALPEAARQAMRSAARECFRNRFEIRRAAASLCETLSEMTGSSANANLTICHSD